MVQAIKLDDTHTIRKTDLLGTHTLEVYGPIAKNAKTFTGSYTECIDEAKRRKKVTL